MRFSSWLRTRISNRSAQTRTPRRPAASRFRPGLETLEDRIVPSGDLTMYTVTSLADSGKNTLREAILRADKGPSAKAYEIDIQVPGTILLESALPDLANTITIKGLGTNKTLIQRDMLAAPFRILTVDAGETAGLSGLGIAQGSAGSGAGGAINNFGNLTLANCTLYTNASAHGGAVANEAGASLTLTSTSFSGNTSSGTGTFDGGGAIWNHGSLTFQGTNSFAGNFAQLYGGAILTFASTTVTQTTFANNSAQDGGAILSWFGANLGVDGCTFATNSASNFGGAIYSLATLTVQGNSSFSGNSAGLYGAAIYNVATATVTQTTFASNSAGVGGGAISNVTGASLTLNTGASFTGNHASQYGGAIANFGTLAAAGASFTNNTADIEGGGIYTYGAATIDGCTFSGNAGNGTGPVDGGGAIWNSGTLTVQGYSSFSGNSASLYGAAIFNFGNATVTQATFANNTATSGTIKNWYGDSLTINAGVSFTGNHVSSYGGAIDNNGTLAASGASFTNNLADIGGGAIYTDGTATFDGCTFSGNAGNGTGPFDGGGAIRVGGGFLAVQGNSSFSGNSAALYGGAIVNFGTTTVAQATFANNTATSGTIKNWYGDSLTINAGVSFTDNHVSSYGGAIDNNGTLTATGASFTNNTAHLSGGAIYTDGAGTIDACTFAHNVANGISTSDGGGAIYNDGTLTVQDHSSFSGNDASHYGGAIDNLGMLTVNGTSFTNNVNEYRGSGIYNDGTASITGCSFSGNTGYLGTIDNTGTATVTGCSFSGNNDGYGGGIFNLGTASVTGCSFSENTAGGFGGGIYNGGSASVTACNFSENNTALLGGGIYNLGSASVTGCNLFGNSAIYGGGIFNETYGVLTVSDCDIQVNSAVGVGGGIYTAAFATTYITGSFVDFNSPDDTHTEPGGNLTVDNSIIGVQT